MCHTYYTNVMQYRPWVSITGNVLCSDGSAEHLHNGRSHHAATTVLGMLAKWFGATVSYTSIHGVGVLVGGAAGSTSSG